MALDCPKEVKPLVMKELEENCSVATLPNHIPDDFRMRLSAVLPFIARDKYASHLARARRVDGVNEISSKMRSRPWEWMESVEPAESPSVLGTIVKNTGSIPLEFFDTTSTGESIVPEAFAMSLQQSYGEVWPFRDSLAAEGLMSRSWRESKVAWDAMSLDGSDMATSSLRGLSPAPTAQSRSSIQMSGSSRQSPSSSRFQPPSMTEVIDVDALPAGPAKASRKRKASGGDDEDEPVLISSRDVGSKTTAVRRARGRGRGKK